MAGQFKKNQYRACLICDDLPLEGLKLMAKRPGFASIPVAGFSSLSMPGIIETRDRYQPRAALKPLLQLGNGFIFPGIEVTRYNVMPRLPHKVKIKGQVMNAGNLQAQYLACFKQMPQVGLIIITAYFAGDTIINGAEIFLPFFVININNAPGGKKHRISPVSRRHYAVKHVNAIPDTFQKIPGRSHAHQVAWLLNG